MSLHILLGMAGTPAQLLIHILKDDLPQSQAAVIRLIPDHSDLIDPIQIHVVVGIIPGSQNHPLIGNPIGLPQQVAPLHYRGNDDQCCYNQHQPQESGAFVFIEVKIPHQKSTDNHTCHDPGSQDPVFDTAFQKRERLRPALPAHLLILPQIFTKFLIHGYSHPFSISFTGKALCWLELYVRQPFSRCQINFFLCQIIAKKPLRISEFLTDF